MNLPSQLRIRALSWLSVAVLTAMSLLALVYVLPYKGLAQLSREGVQVTGQGAAEFRRGNPVPACTFEISAEGDPTTGTFTCAMSDQSVDLGTPFRSLDGQVTTAAASRDRGRLEGTATLELPDGSQMDSVAFVLRVRVGGVDQGALKIRLLGVFDGDPGDAKVGNDAYDQRWQFLTDGSIDIEPGPSPTPSDSPSPTPSDSPSPSPSSSPSPTPSTSPSPTPTFPSPSPTLPAPSPTPSVSYPPVQDAPIPATGASSTARLMALLAEASADGTPHRSDILSVVGPFPVAGLTWWTNDWHAYRCCPYPHLHQGLDMFASIGTPVVAAADGTVSQRVNDAISGLGVEITDAANTQYFYAHLSGFAAGLHVGQHVRLGEIVGYVGNSGNAARTSPHLHFEVQPGGVPVPPKPFVDRWLTMAEAKAEALVRERAGDAAPSASDLARWNALAQALRPPLGMEAGVEGTGIQSGVLTSADPPAPSAGWVVALASGMLLLVLVVPGCFMGRRDARPGGNPP